MVTRRIAGMGLAAYLLAGCGLLIDISPKADDAAVRDAAVRDAAVQDAAARDASPMDASELPRDSGPRRDASEPGLCGNGIVEAGEACDDGNNVGADGCEPDCRLTCEDDLDCDDGDSCSIDECMENRCVYAVAACPAPDACQEFVGCDESASCLYALRDDDGDGHAPSSLGLCGDDCDDRDADIAPGATEHCDGVDEDCDGSIDEGVGRACGEDADRDGYGSSESVLVLCDSGPCPDGYVDDVSDCWDAAGDFFPPPLVAHPGQLTWFEEPRPDGSGSFDWNCDGREEPRDE